MTLRSRFRNVFSHLLLGLVLMVLSQPLSARQHDQGRQFSKLFSEICAIVEQRFVDPELIQTVFLTEKPRYQAEAVAARSMDEFASKVNELLARLQTSHTGFFPKNSQEYFQYLSVFGGLPDIARKFHGRRIMFPSIGIYTKQVDGRTFVFWVLDGSPAATSGVKQGDEILSADGRPFHSYLSLKNSVGKEVSLTLRRKPDQAPLTVRVRPRLINPHDEFVEAVRSSVKVIRAGSRKIGYIHLWSYAGEDYHQIFTDEITGGRLQDTDALIWDLRDGLGGANPTYLNVFNRNVPIMSFRDRNGQGAPYDPQWRKPVVMLTNGRSKSGKEILAYGFKKHRIGMIIGENTGGAVVAGQISMLSDGSLLYCAVAGGTIDGENLEGKGVAPDLEIPMPVPYLAGDDRQLARAVQYLRDLKPLRYMR